MGKKKLTKQYTTPCANPDVNLVIDDGYFSKAATYFTKAGNETIGPMLDKYVSLLKKVKEVGILSGDEAEVIDGFIEYAEKLNSKNFDRIPNNLASLCGTYISQIDEADDYLF